MGEVPGQKRIRILNRSFHLEADWVVFLALPVMGFDYDTELYRVDDPHPLIAL